MAYIGLVTYDDGGRVQSLDGVGSWHDNGRTRNLLGANLNAVSYDDGGRFRSLVGLGQEDYTDLPITPPSDFIPIDYMPPTPSPIFDTTPTEITGSLVPPGSPPAAPIFYQPIVNPSTQSAPIPGTLTPPPSPAAAALPTLNPTAGALTSLFNGIRSVFTSAGSAVAPASAGKIIGTVAPAGTVSATWIAGLPNWGVIAGVGVLGLVLVSVMGSGGGSAPRRSRNPRRRRNGMELVLMGANPSRRRRVR